MQNPDQNKEAIPQNMSDEEQVAKWKDDFVKQGLSLKKLRKIADDYNDRNKQKAAQEMIYMARTVRGMDELRKIVREKISFLSLLKSEDKNTQN